jgi:hypothetical protein
LQCQDIYRKSREKIPVFPVDWLIIENIRAVETSVLDIEAKKMLRTTFRKLLKEERKHRKVIEAIANEKSVLKKGLVLKLMEDRANVAEDAYQCQYCTDFAYISVIKCKNHKYHYCLYH